MPNKYDIVFQQRDSSNTRFLERVVSGSGLIIQTNGSGVLVGSDILQVGTISGSIITASGLYISNNAVLTFPDNFTITGTASIAYMKGTASYALKAGTGGGGTSLTTGSFYPITSSWSRYAITSSNITPPNGILTLNSASFRYLNVSSSNAPLTPNDPGVTGQIKFDEDYAYFYAKGKWRRVPFSLW